MDYLIENLKLLYSNSGWSYETLANKLNEGIPEIQRFSKDQIRSYEQRSSTPKPHFKNVLSKFLGVEVKDLISRQMTVEIINERINSAGQAVIANQYEMIAQQRVILSLLASMKKPGHSPISDNVRNTLQMMVEEEKVKVLEEKRPKS